jgi:hypothetical protein
MKKLHICGGICIAFVAIIIGLAFYMGIFMKVEITEDTLEESIFFYSDQEMQYWDLEPVFDIYCAIEKTLKETPGAPISPVVGFYYDEPDLLVDPKKARSSVGLMVDPKNQTHVHLVKRLIDEKNYTYKQAHLPQIKVMKTECPFRNSFSIYVGLFKFMEPLYEKFVKDYPHLQKDNLGIEIYQETKLTYSIPIEEKKKSYYVTPFPIPEYKNHTIQ